MLAVAAASVLPFAEPAWYGSLGESSPYYGESHRRLRAYVREYVDSFAAHAGDWEEKGVAIFDTSG